MHPFPILERFVSGDVKGRPGAGQVKAGTQVILFTTDLAHPDVAKWPVFGVGPWACAGTSLALAVFKAVQPSRTRGKVPGEIPREGTRGVLQSRRRP